MSAPQWALDLVAQVAKEEGIPFLPEFVWRRSNKVMSFHGTTWAVDEQGKWLHGRIVVTIGRSLPRVMQKLVVLHELAHWVLPKRALHSARFWDKAWELYRRHKIPMYLALRNERFYRKAAAPAYRRNVAKQKNRGKERQ